MATVNKDFRVKNGLIVEGTTATVNGSPVLTEASGEFIQDTVGAMVSGNTETNISVTYDDATGKLNFASTDTNTTYSVSAETVTGGANVRLTGSDATTDDVKIAGAGATTVTRTDANTITISSTDTNTVTNAFSTIAVAGQNNVVADSTSDTLTLVAGTGIGITTADTTDTITVSNSGVTSVNSVTGAVTATNLLDAVKTVDGASSGLDADLLDGNHASAFALSGHNHTLDSLSNVTITSNANGEILKWNGTAWVNNTLSEAGIAAATHSHTSANITDFEEAVEDFAAGMITGATHSGISVAYNDTSNTLAFTNTGVTSITGTANEVEVSASTGGVTVGLPNDVTIGGALVVTGDLTVNGTTTTINTNNLAVEDNIVILNSGVIGTPTLNSGIEVERGDYTNARIYWNETANAWYLSIPGDSAAAATEAEIATGGNLNIFSTVSDGTTSATADSSTDTLTFAAGTGLSVAVNSSTDTVTYSLNSGATAAVGSVTLPDALVGSATATSSGTSVTLDTFSTTAYSSAKYLVQAKNATGDIEVTEVLVAVDGAGNVHITEYGNVFSNASIAEFTATWATNTLTFTANSTTSGVVFKLSKTYLEA